MKSSDVSEQAKRIQRGEVMCVAMAPKNRLPAEKAWPADLAKLEKTSRRCEWCDEDCWLCGVTTNAAADLAHGLGVPAIHLCIPCARQVTGPRWISPRVTP